MKWTLDWLKEYLKTDASAEKIADTLTRIGLEVEDVIAPVAPIAAKIVECAPVPNSDHLHILQVDDGTATLRQVVCGAPNARVGLVSALALPGCVIQGHEIQSGKLRGVVSNGMMCSGLELGLNDDHSGIVELDENTKIGSPVIDMPIVFDAGITPNRPDYLAVRGIARDLSAAGIGEYIAPDDGVFGVSGNARAVNIQTDKCRAYKLCEIHNIKMSPSNRTIASRLAAIGINPKNAPIDATNYICYDMAQPMHCFDSDEIHGDITVRMAQDKEQFTDLFGNVHELQPTDIVIADDKGILALAGVVGGARGMTTENTKNIILESAYFDPVCVRKTSKRLGISTDASYRYERGIDTTITGPALMCAVKIITDACGGNIVGFSAAGTDSAPNTKIEFSPDLFLKKTGIEMPSEEMREILSRLGYTGAFGAKVWSLTPPHSRVDVQIPETIVADLIRIYGYDKVAQSEKHTSGEFVHSYNSELQIKDLLASRNLNECKTFGFGCAAHEDLLSNRKIIKIANPITADLDTARNGLLGGLLRVVSDNEKRGFPNLNLFEVGTVFTGDTPNAQQTEICIVRTGATSPRHWMRRNRDVDIYDVKADLIALMRGQHFTTETDNAPKWAHPFRYGRIVQGKKQIAEFGELNPMVAHALKIKTNVVVAIVFDANAIPHKTRHSISALSEFQPITRDFAFIVDSDFPAEKIVHTAVSVDKRIVNAVVFDSFVMDSGKKSIAFTLTIQPNENMSDTDLLQLQSAVITKVEKQCNAQIRDK